MTLLTKITLAEQTDDARNVLDQYKGMAEEDIKIDLARHKQDFAVVMMQWQHDFNFGSLVRNANAFGAEQVFYVGDSRKWDKRSAVGTQHYMDIIHYDTEEEFYAAQGDKWFLCGVENNIPEYEGKNFYHDLGQDFTHLWHPMFIFGEEGKGLSEYMLSKCDILLGIPQYGSVRSLNASTASGIIMYDYVSKRRQDND